MRKKTEFNRLKIMDWVGCILLILLVIVIISLKADVKECREKNKELSESYENLQTTYQIRSRELCELECPVVAEND